MARPTIPEAEKRRTVPFRMTKLDYRALTLLMKLHDTTIQEHLRNALNQYVERTLADVAPQVDFKLPSTYELGSWSDEAFNAWLSKLGNRNPEAAPRRGFKIKPVEATA